MEHDNEQLLRRRAIRARRLSYETLVPDHYTAIAVFVAALGVAVPPMALAAMPTLDAVSDDWNAAAEQRFRREQRDLVAAVESGRARFGAHAC